MNPVAKAISLTFAYYNGARPLQDDVLKMYVSDLADIPPDLVVSAYNSWRLSSKNRRFPLPAEIRELIYPQSNAQDDAQYVGPLIITAVRKFGSAQSSEARAFIGELGWEVVQLNGGWNNLCCTMSPEDERIYLAQFRGLAESVHRRHQRGEQFNPPALPQPNNPSIEVSKLVKTIKLRSLDDPEMIDA